VFEQSLLLSQHRNGSWNFLASLGAELLVVSLALLIPLAYRDHLPAFHWKDITVGPAPAPAPIAPVVAHSSNATSATLSATKRPIFQLNLGTNRQPVRATSTDFTYDAPPIAGLDTVGGSTNLLGRFIPNIIATPQPPPTPIAETHKPSAPIPVGGGVQMAKLVRKIIPEYPSIAKTARISGVVHLIGTIAKDGTIRNLQLVSGHPMLARAAIEAVQQWVYRPTLLNGQPVEVIAPIEVTFTLAQ
jgi:periplasmic protein TonB